MSGVLPRLLAHQHTLALASRQPPPLRQFTEATWDGYEGLAGRYPATVGKTLRLESSMRTEVA